MKFSLTIGLRPTMKKEDFTIKVVNLIDNSVPYTAQKIDDHDKELAAFGIDSMDMWSIALALEETFSLKISDEELKVLTTVNSLVNYVWGSNDTSSGNVEVEK